jgi:hypothetical protein
VLASKRLYYFVWISSDDFRSKLTVAVLQNLLGLAQTHHAPGAVVTIPTG